MSGARAAKRGGGGGVGCCSEDGRFEDDGAGEPLLDDGLSLALFS